MTQPYGRIGVVVAEEGAETQPHVEELRRGGAELLVLTQRRGESMEGFVRRCRRRLDDVFGSGACLTEARVVGGGASGHERLVARAALVRMLVAPMARQQQGKLVLAGTEEDALAMRGLAAVVGEQVRGTGVCVSASAGAGSETEAGLDDDGREARA